MHVRYPFAGCFAALCLLAAYAGLTPLEVSPTNDKVLHILTFFVLTLTFYWSVEAPRRFLLKIVFITCALVLGVGSEFLQAALPNGRFFDALDIAANLVGSVVALAICSWYHGRILERKRRRKLEGYGLLGPGEEIGDLELGDGGGRGHQIGVEDDRPEGDGGETGEAWDELEASEGGDADPRHGTISKVIAD
ncbi:hypothetical protein MMC26_007172 [Xylographa opegraphella]|nr:hypothetical protein [Xylographa opegraphella]